MSYNIIEETGNERDVNVTFSETYYRDGSVGVTMRVEIPGDLPYEVEFDNPAQVEKCMWQMQQYLKNRNTFRKARQEESTAAEPEMPYGE